MTAMLTAFTAALVALIPITNPVGALAVFSGMTASSPPGHTRRMAWRTGMWVAVILAVFALVGSLIMSAFGISLPALQIAGGLVVAHSGFGMLDNSDTVSDSERSHAAIKSDISFTPLALPLIAGPGAIGVVIALAARHPGIEARIGIVVATLVLGVVIALLLRYATPWVERIGATGVGALVRVMGFLILAIGVELVAHGVLTLMR